MFDLSDLGKIGVVPLRIAKDLATGTYMAIAEESALRVKAGAGIGKRGANARCQKRRVELLPVIARHDTVNTVAPCAVNTPQLSELRERNPELVDRWVSVIPMARAAEMGEVASMVSHLASTEAAYVTGQVISVNGGSTML